jgi:hypothetical protein
MRNAGKQAAVFATNGLKRFIAGILIVAMLVPSSGMAYVRCDGTETDSTGVGDGYCEGGSWLAPETEADVIPIRDNTYHEQPPSSVYGKFHTAYVDTRNGNAYEVEADLDTGVTLIRDAAGVVFLQGQFGVEDLALAREAMLNIRNGDPKANAVVELIVISLVTGLIITVVQVTIENAIERENERKQCVRDYFLDANRLSADAIACGRSGGNFVILHAPSMSMCGGSSGVCN